MTFAGRRSRVRWRVHSHLYIDPQGPLTDPGLRFSEIEFKPRLFFYDPNLWETALKLKVQVENRNSMHRQYGEALGKFLLAHDLVRINGNADPLSATADRGGLARLAAKATGRIH